MRILAVAATLLAAVLLSACGGDDGEAAGTRTTVVSIDEALASGSEELLVRGNLLAALDEVRLCDALAESFPPQCGGPSLAVLGLDLDAVDGLVTEGDVSWTDRPVELRGVVANGTLTVSENAKQ